MSIPLPKHEAPPSRLIVEQSHLDHPQSRHAKIIKSHSFNYKMETIIPLVEDKQEIGNDSEICGEKYFEARIQAGTLIHKAFIEAFVKRGNLTLMSVQTKIDTDDVMALDPRGHLFFHLCRTSYQQLGLDGKPSTYNKKLKLPNKYVVEIDLTKAYFQPGKPNYERVRECLLNNHQQFYTVVFKWIPIDDKISPLSVCKYFESFGYTCKEMTTSISRETKNKITHCPVIDGADVEGENGTDYQAFYEWLGAVSCLNCIKSSQEADESDSFISTYLCPEPHYKVSGLQLESSTGLVHTSDISSVFSSLRDKAVRHGWCAMTVYGFQDAPVTFNSNEHGYLLDGDNIYTFVVFSDGTYWLYMALSSYDDIH